MKPTIAIFVHHPECSQDCADGMVTALSPDFEIRMFDERELNAGRFEDVDIVAFGGGIGDADRYYDFFKRREGNTIADFVSRGGKYLGICMGAYWAGRSYFDLLDGLEPVQFIKRKDASVRRSYSTVAEVDWQGKKEMMFFYDGCTFTGNGRCQIVSRYSNQEPMAVIQGRVGLIGCHPESEKKWFDDLKYIRNNWHEGRHHELLRSFAKKLLRQK